MLIASELYVMKRNATQRNAAFEQYVESATMVALTIRPFLDAQLFAQEQYVLYSSSTHIHFPYSPFLSSPVQSLTILSLSSTTNKQNPHANPINPDSKTPPPGIDIKIQARPPHPT